MKTKDCSPGEITKHRLPVLLRRFEHEYGGVYVRLSDHLRRTYPDITRKGRRTSRALRNICFFVWYYTLCSDRNLIPALFDASVLLFAQDDYYDNPRIPNQQKEAFCSITNNTIRTAAHPSAAGWSRQARELMSLWSAVAQPIDGFAPAVQSYWKEKACQLNDAMATENRAARRTDLGFDEYMRTAIHSIGAVFIWSTYLVHRGVPRETLGDLDSVLLLGAKVVRLINDMASYRQGKNKYNAVILLGGDRPAERRVSKLIAQENDLFLERVSELPVEPDIKWVMLRSTSFLREFYQRSDFDRRPLR